MDFMALLQPDMSVLNTVRVCELSSEAILSQSLGSPRLVYTGLRIKNQKYRSHPSLCRRTVPHSHRASSLFVLCLEIRLVDLSHSPMGHGRLWFQESCLTPRPDHVTNLTAK